MVVCCLRGSRGLRVLLAGLAFLFTVCTALTVYTVVTNYQQIGNLLRVLQLIETEYIGQVRFGTLVEGAIDGMVRSLDDPYSAYLEPENYARFREQIRGSFGGIGILVGMRSQGLLVIKPFAGTPAARAGIREGDVITEIDGFKVSEMDLETAVAMIHGPIGTKVGLVVKRENYEQPLRFTITREEITIPSVEYKFLEPGVGYISVSQFSEQTPPEVHEALSELRSKGLKGLILDLRNNPGGNLGSAVEISDLFIDEGPVVYIDYRSGKDEVFEGKPEKLGLPLVVLVNQDSASAAEIVAGAVKDTKAGTLVGTRTFGKGVVQNLFPLRDGAGLKLTTARYLTPNRTDIHKKGIEPDVVVEQPEGSARDVQLDKALEVLKSEL